MGMNSQSTFPSSRRGFTLIGLLLAFALVVIVVVALGTLTASIFRASRSSKERFIATALAREGVELVRSLRDDNWFSTPRGTTSIKWRGDSAGTTDERRRAICNGTWIIDVEDPRLRAPAGASAEGELFLASGSGDTVYGHTAGGSPTIYRRRITITTGGTGSGDCGESVTPTQSPRPNPVLVTSRVEWRERPTDPLLSLDLHQRLYDWVRQR